MLSLQAYSNVSYQLAASSSTNDQNVVYLQDSGALSAAGTSEWYGLVATGVNSVFTCQASGSSDSSGVVLVLLSDRPRAWSQRERFWGLAIAKKLVSIMPHHNIT